jgi:gliding motility associated protien GldN
MKRFYYITSIFLVLTLFAQAQQNQTGPRTRTDRNRQQTENASRSGLPELSVRAKNMNEQLTRDVGNARWMRTIYRELDLTNDKNAPLYFPVQELNGSVNFFTKMFRLVSEGKIKVYKYLSDYDSFDEENILPFKELLDNFNIYYEEVPAGGGQQARYVINASDIPSGEVKSFYVKEAWYFDQNNSLYDVKILAVCPITYMLTDVGEQRMPMFWTQYEDVSPYIKSDRIMTSNLNNARLYTVDDFFRLRMFEGEIVKTENLMNLAMQQMYEDPDTLKIEQQKIEDQLLSFNDSLWIKPDTTVVLSKKEAKAASKTTRGTKKEATASASKKEPKQPKVKQEKQPAIKSAPTRSIRR